MKAAFLLGVFGTAFSLAFHLGIILGEAAINGLFDGLLR